jgi:urease accessory protein
VLDAMARGLGLDVAVQDAPFEPEPGAYGGQSEGSAPDQVQGQGHAHHH